MTLPVWLTSARETIDEAIAAESSKQQQEVASDAQAALDDTPRRTNRPGDGGAGRPGCGLARRRHG